MRVFSNIGLRIVESGLRDGYIADKLRVSKKTVYNWKNGIGYPTFEKAFILADLLGCKVDDLAEIKREEDE